MLKAYWKKNRTELRSMLFVIGMIFCLGLILFGFLLRNYRASMLRYEITNLNKKKKDLFIILEKLRLNIADRSTTSRLQQLYHEKYGYTPVQFGKKIISLQLPQNEKLAEIIKK